MILAMNRRPTILIADNDSANVQLLTDICEAEGLVVRVAYDGEQTLKSVQELRPDLLLLDVMMPKYDGFAVLKELRAQPSTCSLPVILVTAISDDEAIREAYRLGTNDYITKPFKVVELVARMRTLLEAAAYHRLADEGQGWEVGDAESFERVLGVQLAKEELAPIALVLFRLQTVHQLMPGKLDHPDTAPDPAFDVMKLLAERLRSQLRGVDSAYLLAEDLLAFVLVGTSQASAERVVTRLEQQLVRPFVVEEQELSIRGAWGIAIGRLGQAPLDLLETCVGEMGTVS